MRPIVLTPGPIEIDPRVQHALGYGAESHFTLEFTEVFGQVLHMLRRLFRSRSPTAQPFVISGSGTLGWDIVGANFIETGDSILLLNTGVFSKSFERCLRAYGANAIVLSAPAGENINLAELAKLLSSESFKAVVVTHVDTSTGVRVHLDEVAAVVRENATDALIIVDGVCSVACENLRFDDWDLDVVVTGSQKAIGCPPGLSICMMSARALAVSQRRASSSTCWYVDVKNWLPIMQKFERYEPGYFATPPTQLIRALHASLSDMFETSLPVVIERHRVVSARIRSSLDKMGLQTLVADDDDCANGLTVVRLPKGLSARSVISACASMGITFAASIHPDLGNQYLRFGHMGYSVMCEEAGHIQKGLATLEKAVSSCAAQEIGHNAGQTLSSDVTVFSKL